MSIQHFSYFSSSCDQSKLKVITGDISEGFWELDGTRLKKVPRTSAEATEVISLEKNVKIANQKDSLNKDPFEALMGGAVGALLGLRFGPVGLIGGACAGMFLMRHTPEISVNLELNDGRRFMAVMSPAMLEKLQSFLTERRKEFIL